MGNKEAQLLFFKKLRKKLRMKANKIRKSKPKLASHKGFKPEVLK